MARDRKNKVKRCKTIRLKHRNRKHYKFTSNELLAAINKAKDLIKNPPEKSKYESCKRWFMLSSLPGLKSGHQKFAHTYLVHELRKCLLRHDWYGACKILLVLVDGPKYLSTIIWRSCILVLKNHPMSSSDMLKDFVRMSSGSEELDMLYCFKC
ncbi:uncharacterized protein LOC124802778 isoform X1 [Schistocerca piceifrons]|uniref:uncharacterized protein LOC124802778 isoform X1 n=1 Tax=Schistocerca piceifrons TaxID=274613 RepID=UPI001F5E752B|nr:uncharacterized protein LOC124802778 isoform X1 [Schistocerca piceifrons]